MFSPDSPFNKPVDKRIAPVANSAKIAANIAKGHAEGNGSNPFRIVAGRAAFHPDILSWQHPIYAAGPNDPIKTIKLVPPWGGAPGASNGMKVRVPAAARPAANMSKYPDADGHLGIIDGEYEFDFWQVKSMSGSEIVASNGGRAPLTGPGFPNGGTAGLFSLGLGCVRPDELYLATKNYPAMPIQHALFSVFAKHGSGAGGPVVWPCLRGKGTNVAAPDYPWYSHRLWLDVSQAEIDRQPLHLRPLLVCMRDYGCFMGDTGGGTIKIESSNYTAWECCGNHCSVPRDSSTGNYIWKITGIDFASQLRTIIQPK